MPFKMLLVYTNDANHIMILAVSELSVFIGPFFEVHQSLHCKQDTCPFKSLSIGGTQHEEIHDIRECGLPSNQRPDEATLCTIAKRIDVITIPSCDAASPSSQR